MADTTLTFRVDEALKNEFTTAAKARDRTSAQLLRDFMRDFVRRRPGAIEHDAWFRQEVEAALTEASDPATRWISNKEAQRESAAWRQQLQPGRKGQH